MSKQNKEIQEEKQLTANQVWRTKAGDFCLIVNNLTDIASDNPGHDFVMLWYDRVDGTWNMSDILDRLDRITTMSAYEFFREIESFK